VGVFTGYSALSVALALPADGSLLACDVSDEYTRIGIPFWREAGVAARIELVLGPARETLDRRIARVSKGASTSPSSMPTSPTTTRISSSA
jgi:predicted O-methyltransferase YrrM